MLTKNLLKLHEAISVVLLSKPERTANYQEIASEINERGLYKRKDDFPIPAYQIKQRTTLSKGFYQYLFEKIDKEKIRLRNV